MYEFDIIVELNLVNFIIDEFKRIGSYGFIQPSGFKKFGSQESKWWFSSLSY